MPLLRESFGRFEQQGVDKRLRHVAAHLALRDVVLLAEQTWVSAGSAVALKPAVRLHLAALLVQAERGEEAAQQERTLRPAQRPLILAESTQVSLATELGQYRIQGSQSPRIFGSQRAPDRRCQ